LLQENNKVNCWVTGAHGFIGRHLSLYLASCGWRVAGIGHGAWAPSETVEWGLDYWLNGNLGISNLVQMQRDCGIPDVIFHLAGGSAVGAALAHPLEDFRRSVVSTSELLEWMRLNAREVQLVVVSSAAVYGAQHSGTIQEEAQTAPFSCYGAHKLLMEDLCRSYAKNFRLSVVITRLFSVYGDGLKKQLLWDLCEKLDSQNPVQLGGSGSELRDWINVHDVVQGLKLAAPIASMEAPIINFGSGRGTTIREVAAQVAMAWAAFGGPLLPITFSGQSRQGDPFSLVADVRKMEVELGFKNSISESAGFAEYVKWYLSQKSNS
jgi:UDP-glucose 4-epimerase